MNRDYISGRRFVVTGEFENHTRKEIENAIKKCGAGLTRSVSSKTDFLVKGSNPGKTKMNAAIQHGTEIITESDLISLMENTTSDDARTIPSNRLIFQERYGDGTTPSGFCTHNHMSLKQANYCPNRENHQRRYNRNHKGDYRIMATDDGGVTWRELTDDEIIQIDQWVEERAEMWDKFYDR